MLFRWAVRHGMVKLVLRRSAQNRQPQAVLMLDRASRENPYPLYDEIRSRGPIWRGDRTYVTGSHRAVSAVLRSDAFLVGLDLTGVPWPIRRMLDRGGDGRIVGPIDPPSLLAVDPPQHTKYRRQVAKVFTPRAVAALEPRIGQLADTLLDDLAGQDVVDLVAGYAALLPVMVIAEILGVPVQLRDQFLSWGNAAAASLDVPLTYREYRDSERGIRGLNLWMYEHIERLRADPGDDLLSQLITVEDDGVRMSDVELMVTASLLLAAGFETTVNLLGNGAQLLLDQPDQLKVLREQPDLWPNAIEEILRFESPVQSTARYAGVETEICGLPIPKGGFVQTLIGAANRDPEVFKRPELFDVRRPNAREHLAFSAGVHYCVGAALARCEGRIGLQMLFERYPELAPAGPPTRRQTRILRGYQRLPLRLVPQQPSAPRLSKITEG